MITAIVSGGQTGADLAGLKAGRQLGLKTGGFAPLGWLTEKGPAPWLGTMFGLVECESADYSVRTELNVLMSTATVIFGSRSSGSNLTEALCKEHGKPCLWLKEYQQQSSPAHFRLWAERNQVTILNVAGNRESRAPGIEIAVGRFLCDILPLCRRSGER